MPFGPYRNHADCVRKVSHKKNPPRDPDAYCAWVKRKIEGKDPTLTLIFEKYKEWKVDLQEAVFAYYRFETVLMVEFEGLELMTKEKALDALRGKQVWKGDDPAVILDDHRWLHMWANTIKDGNTLFINRKQLRRLHDLVVDELDRIGSDSGREHKSPMDVGVLELGGPLEDLLKSRKEFLVDPEFINLVGSSVTGKEDADLDILFKSSQKEFSSNFIDSLPNHLRESVDVVLEPGGPNGPYIPAYELWAIPVKNPKPKEPKYNIHPMSPIPPATPQRKISDARDLLEDSYFIAEPKGLRAMIHRSENSVIAFDKNLEEIDLPPLVEAAVLAVEDPKTFILDGFLSANAYHMLDLPWWRDSEHINQNAEQRRFFLNKIKRYEGLQLAPVQYFSNRHKTIEYLEEESGPFLVIPGFAKYPSDGKADWYLYERTSDLKLEEGADAQIEDLLDSSKWENMSANERFRLMTKRRTIKPLQPYAQMKTTKKGYSQKEVFGLSSVEDLAKELFRVPNKQAVETKIDGFRVQAHRRGDQVRLFTESGHEITKQLPTIVADLKRAPAKEFVLDAEATPYSEDLTNMGRAGAAPVFAKGAKKPVDDSRWALHIFDVLYIDGEELHNQPYEARRKRLHGLEFPIREYPKQESDFKYHIWENEINWATTAEGMVKLAEKVTAVPGSEGAMFKQSDSKYRLTGNTPLWSKMKATFELDALVVGKTDRGYIGAIGPVDSTEGDPAPLDTAKGKKFVKWKGKSYSVLGKTFNTKLEADIGGIIRVSVKDIRKLDDQVYHWFHPQVLEVREDKTKPDPIDTAETINQAVKKKQRAVSWDIVNGQFQVKGGNPPEAYLIKARYGFHSPLACCYAPWIAVPDLKNNDWIYLQNTDDVYGKLVELGVGRIMGTATERELLEKMQTHNIDFDLVTGYPTIASMRHKSMHLVEPVTPQPSKIDPKRLKFFFTDTAETKTPRLKLGCGSTVPLKQVIRMQDAYQTYPEKEQRWSIQFHVRGLSVHGDFRLTISKSQAIGWTLDAGKSLIKVLVKQESPERLKKAGIKESDFQLKNTEFTAKLNKTAEGREIRKEAKQKTQDISMSELRKLLDELWELEIAPILDDPNTKILTQKKSPMSPEWLDYEAEIPAGAVGATRELEGHLIIMDKGSVAFGSQKSYFHEYFIKGKRIGERRIVVRRIPTRKEWQTRQSFAWMTFFPKQGELPYTISQRAVTQNWIPPEGVSALPQEVESQIPRNRRYWKAKNRREVRDLLVSEIKSKKTAIKLAAGLKFSVKRVWHKGPEVRRGLAVTRYWLLIHDGSKVHDAFDFGKDSNPLTSDGLVARRKANPDLTDLLATTGELEPTHSASYTSRLKSQFDTSDTGRVEILEDDNNRLHIKFHGGKLTGNYAFIKQSGDTWVLQKTELSATSKAILLSAVSKRVIRCGTEEVQFKEQDGLLLIRGPAIKPGEVLPMDGRPTYFEKEGIKRFWPSMPRQPIVVLHGDLKGDVVGFVNKAWYDEKTGWGWVEGVVWHPMAIQLILSKKLSSFSIEVVPETIWDAEHQHDHVIGGKCIGLSVVPKGACPTCNPVDARIGTIADIEGGKVYKFGMTMQQFLHQQYYEQGKSTREIAEGMGMPRSTVENWMKRFGIPRLNYKEARHRRSLKEKRIKDLGGRTTITALGTGSAFILEEDNPQFQEAQEGGYSKRNSTATLFSIANDHLLINAPKNIGDMLALKNVKPKYVLIENIDEETIAGLHQLRSLKPTVLTTREIWDYLRTNYKTLTGEQGKFEDIYAFNRIILPVEKKIKIGSYLVNPVLVNHSKKGEPNALGYKIGMGSRTIFHCTSLHNIPKKKQILKDIDLYIGDGSSLKKTIGSEHASMVEQIKWASESEIPKVFFTRIGFTGLTHEDLNIALQQLAPHAEALHDGAEVSLGGENPMAHFSESVALGLLSGDVNVLIRGKPYSEYSRQAILFGHGDTAVGLFVEGFPEQMPLKEAIKEEHGLESSELKEFGETVWVYRPRILKRFDEAQPLRNPLAVGPYIHDAQTSPPGLSIEE